MPENQLSDIENSDSCKIQKCKKYTVSIIQTGPVIIAIFQFKKINSSKIEIMKNCNWILLVLAFFIVSCSKSKNRTDDSEYKIKINSEFFKEFGDVYPYLKSNISSKVLTKCAYADEREKSCSESDLAFIRNDKSEDRINTILKRTLVSHDYLGKNFEVAIRKIKSEFLWDLFGAVNTIVISEKIGVSFYSSYSGSIYISAKYLWTTKEQKDRVYQVKDTRGDNIKGSNFASLPFEFFASQMKNGDAIARSEYSDSRTINDLIDRLYRLLIHELAHANDYNPASLATEIDATKPVGLVLGDRYIEYKLLSDSFPTYPREELPTKYAKSFYGNDDIAKELIETTAEIIAEQYDRDCAVDDYAYYNTKEDFAMTVEDIIVLSEYGIERVQGIASYPNVGFEIPEDYNFPLVWGQKNRILKPEIKSRAEYALGAIFHEKDLRDFYKSLDEFSLTNAQYGQHWYDFKVVRDTFSERASNALIEK